MLRHLDFWTCGKLVFLTLILALYMCNSSILKQNNSTLRSRNCWFGKENKCLVIEREKWLLTSPNTNINTAVKGTLSLEPSARQSFLECLRWTTTRLWDFSHCKEQSSKHAEQTERQRRVVFPPLILLIPYSSICLTENPTALPCLLGGSNQYECVQYSDTFKMSPPIYSLTD